MTHQRFLKFILQDGFLDRFLRFHALSLIEAKGSFIVIPDIKSQVVAADFLGIADSELIKLITDLLSTRCLIDTQVFDEEGFYRMKHRIVRDFFNGDEEMS